MPPQSGYSSNGYGQSYGANQQQMGYAAQPEYDQSASGYQDYRY